MMKILHRISGKLLFEFETNSMKVCVEAAVKEKNNLGGANLGECAGMVS